MNKPAVIIGIVLLALLGIAGLVALAFALEIGGLEWSRYFGPKHEDVRRETFEKTRSFNEAKKQELVKYRLEYMRSRDPQDKKAIASTIRLAFADYDASRLDPELRDFLEKIMLEKEIE